MTSRRLQFASLLAGVFVLFAACDGGGSGTPPPSAADGVTRPPVGPGTPVTIKAGDLFLEPPETTVPPGAITFTYMDVGVQAHTLLIDGVGGFKLEVASKGDTDTGNVALKPGRYTLYCDVPGHRAAGMESTLVVQ
ncbi:MAG TPA: plastocyanin/azurin family copper-binding protein [Acidimicrobiia bacterium]|jgi:plastocyanin